MLKGLKDFLFRGNILELAVAVLIAGAFGLVVSSFTNDIIMPPIGLLLGDVDFASLEFVLKTAEGDNPAVTIGYGKFINSIINFVIIGVALYFVKQGYDKVNPPAPPAEYTLAAPTQEELLTEIRDLLKKQ